MKSKLIHKGDLKTYALIFEKGDEVISGLTAFARENGLSGTQIAAIGAFSEVVLGFFDRQKKEYLKIPIREQVEVLSFLGDVALEDGQPKLHVHVVVGKSDGSAYGGHLLEGRVWPTLEVILTEAPRHLHRKYDPETGLTLIAP